MCFFETGVWMEEMRSNIEGMFEKELGFWEGVFGKFVRSNAGVSLVFLAFQ